MFLAAKPCCEEIHLDSNGKQCLIEKKEGDCSKDPDCLGCSPFFSCSSCTGFMVFSTKTEVKPSVTVTDKRSLFSYNHLYAKEIYLSIWQPPKLA